MCNQAWRECSPTHSAFIRLTVGDTVKREKGSVCVRNFEGRNNLHFSPCVSLFLLPLWLRLLGVTESRQAFKGFLLDFEGKNLHKNTERISLFLL